MFYDVFSLDKAKRRKTADGYVVAQAKSARTGIQQYLGREIGLDNDEVYSVYRPKDAVMSKSFLSSYSYKPITDDHPEDPVTSSNWRDLAVGVVGEVVPDGEWIITSMMLTDADTIAKVDSGKSEISVGYEAEIVEQAGEYEGVKYSHVQIPKRVNHVAIVDRARAGREAAIFDNDIKDSVKDFYQERNITLNVTKIKIGDASYQVAEDDADDLMKVISDKDEFIGQLKAECAEAKSKIISDEAIWGKVQELLMLATRAREVIGDSYTADGKSPDEIKRDVVKARFGEDAVKEATSDAEIDGIYKVAVRMANDSAREAIADKKPMLDAEERINAAIKKRFSKGIE